MPTCHREFTDLEAKVAKLMQPRLEDWQLVCPTCTERACMVCDKEQLKVWTENDGRIITEGIICPNCQKPMRLIPIPCLVLVQHTLEMVKGLKGLL